MIAQRKVRAAFLEICLLILGLVIGGCTSVRLMADYDPRTDDGVTALQRATETFLVELERTCETPEGAYDRHVPFYDDARVELSALRVRADAIALNQQTVEQLKLLRESFDLLESQHKRGFKPLVVAQTRESLNTLFTAILRLELAKKRNLSNQETP